MAIKRVELRMDRPQPQRYPAHCLEDLEDEDEVSHAAIQEDASGVANPADYSALPKFPSKPTVDHGAGAALPSLGPARRPAHCLCVTCDKSTSPSRGSRPKVHTCVQSSLKNTVRNK